jgi:Rieske 2Fe-2S family protein
MTALAERIARQRTGWSLEAAFYRDPEIHAVELAATWRRRWLFVGHGCEIREPGAFFTLALERDELIIVRGRDGIARAFHNVCRHRGSRICLAEQGRVHRLVCPYHAWTYDLDGRLQSDMREHGVDAADHGLKPAGLVEMAGLLFVRIGAEGEDFAPAAAALGPGLAPQGLARARVAKRVDYLVAANWKVVFENNRECLHCPTTHPEYIRANYDVAFGNPRDEAALAARVAAESLRWQRQGLAAPSLTSDMTARWYRLNRTPLVPGYVTESLDGKPVAPVMGDYLEHDVGTLRVTVFPNFWMHGSGDHAVTTRLIPDGPETTRVRVAWLVRDDAEEGRDYQLERLMPFWQRTSEQDWTICENVQRGVASSAYAPGPLARFKERNVAQFIDWYLDELRAQLGRAR